MLWNRNQCILTLIHLCKGKVVTATPDGSLSHERVVAKCHLPDGTDLSAEMVRLGMALDWPQYSGGAYLELEPDGVRKRLWRADARQKGRHDLWSTPYTGAKKGDRGPDEYRARRRRN